MSGEGENWHTASSSPPFPGGMEEERTCLLRTQRTQACHGGGEGIEEVAKGNQFETKLGSTKLYLCVCRGGLQG